MRFNAYRSAQLFVSAKPGYSSGQAMAALEEVFAETMPREMGYDYSGMSFQEKAAAEGVRRAVYSSGSRCCSLSYILAAQYESWALPFSVLLCTPIAVFGAFGGLWSLGLENNVFTQIGLVMLIGLSARIAILIVEFAKVEYEKGQGRRGGSSHCRPLAAAAHSDDVIRTAPSGLFRWSCLPEQARKEGSCSALPS